MNYQQGRQVLTATRWYALIQIVQRAASPLINMILAFFLPVLSGAVVDIFLHFGNVLRRYLGARLPA